MEERDRGSNKLERIEQEHSETTIKKDKGNKISESKIIQKDTKRKAAITQLTLILPSKAAMKIRSG